MSFEFKCECGSVLLVIVKDENEVPTVMNANGWKPNLQKEKSYFAWADTIPAVCPICQKNQ